MARRGPGNPSTSPWYSTSSANRTRKPMTITLSAEGRRNLDTLAQQRGYDSVSALIEALATEALAKR